jgi:hypothetical protein
VVVSLRLLTEFILSPALLQFVLKGKDLFDLLVALEFHLLPRALQPLDALLVCQLVPKAVCDLVNQLLEFGFLVAHKNVVGLHVLVLVLVQHLLKTALHHLNLLLHALLCLHDVVPDPAGLLSRKNFRVRLRSLIDVLDGSGGLEVSEQRILHLEGGAGDCLATGALVLKEGLQ